ncbi:MAG TPA: methyltransferase [Planctomycetaceae bacterium]
MSTTTSFPTGNVDGSGHRTARLLFEVGGNVVLSLFFLQFLVIHGRNFLADHRLSTLLLVAKVGTDVLFYLIRRVPKEVSLSPYDWAIGLMGTFMVAFFRPDAHGSDGLLAQGLQLLGLGMQVAAMLSLNTSIGITAANRGVKTGGMYRLVRHPLYLSYIVAYGGYLLSHFTPQNAMVYAAAVLLWVLRLVAEERLLSKDPQYAAFRQRVRWRLIPYVF